MAEIQGVQVCFREFRKGSMLLMRTFFVTVIVIITSLSVDAETVKCSTLEPEVPSYVDRLINKTVGRLFEKPNVRLIQENGRIYLSGEDVDGKKKIATQL